MDKKTEALKLALEALNVIDRADDDRDFLIPDECRQLCGALTAIREALADSALERMAKNERELGIDYMRPAEIPQSITCPFCESQHVPGWLHDYNMDRGAYGEQPAQQRHISYVCPQCHWSLDKQPASKPWVGLTDEERAVIVEANTTDDHGYDIWCDGDGVAQVVEAKLKEKNT